MITRCEVQLHSEPFMNCSEEANEARMQKCYQMSRGEIMTLWDVQHEGKKNPSYQSKEDKEVSPSFLYQGCSIIE